MYRAGLKNPNQRYLIALDKERHFGRAAKRAFVSQPTLSVAVKKLEGELGVTVFERNRGEARVTPIGRRIIEQAYRILGEVSALETVAEQGRDELKGSCGGVAGKDCLCLKDGKLVGSCEVPSEAS